MNTYITADIHLGHEGVRKHCNRPWASVEEMDEAIIDRWNSTIKGRSLVYIVGDFAWRDHNKYLARLKGKKILIRGNHDRMSLKCLENFTEVHDMLFRKIEGQEVFFCHYCMQTWNKSCHGSWHVHGHSHGRIAETGFIPKCDVGVDVWDYCPVPWEVIRKKLESRKRGFSGNITDLDSNIEKNRSENLALLKGVI